MADRAQDAAAKIAELCEKGVRRIEVIGARASYGAHLLTELARETGGQVHFPNSLSELDGVYDRIAEELRTQYNLGYVSSNAKRDGKWRRIVVRTPQRDDLQIRNRVGYFATAP